MGISARNDERCIIIITQLTQCKHIALSLGLIAENINKYYLPSVGSTRNVRAWF